MSVATTPIHEYLLDCSVPEEHREFLAAATDTKLTVQECLCATEQELAQFLFPNNPRVLWRVRSALEWIVPLLREKERARHAQSIDYPREPHDSKLNWASQYLTSAVLLERTKHMVTESRWSDVVLDVSNNYIGAGISDPDLCTRMTALARTFKLVVVVGNPFASIDYASYWQTTAPDEHVLTKFIFVPRHWLFAKNWQRLVHPGQADAVMGAHCDYYRLPQPSSATSS